MEVEQDWLVDMIHQWLPRLLDQLSYMHRTFPVLVNGAPSTINMALNSKDVEELLSMNADYIMRLSAVQHIEPLP